MSDDMISINGKIILLFREGRDRNGKLLTLAGVARITGLSAQALLNLVQGQSHNPHLQTLLKLAQVYGISLDYFTLDTEEACRSYLRHSQLKSASPLICEIESLSNQLTPRGKRNALKILHWIIATGRLPQQQRKHQQNDTRTETRAQ